MKYEEAGVSVDRHLGGADAVASDLRVSLKTEHGHRLEISRTEFEKMFEAAPSFWFEGVGD